MIGMTKAEIIKVGDKVRSFDFHDRDANAFDACYVEGVVESIEGHPLGGGGEYLKFKITKKVFSGKNVERTVGEYNWVPQNGQETWTGDITDHVVKIG
jgi:hypothetical protein